MNHEIAAHWYGDEFQLKNDCELTNSSGLLRLLELATIQVDFAFPTPQILESSFQLIYGIGETTAVRLHDQGYDTLNDLTFHPKWGKAACDIIRLIESRNVKRLAAYGASDLQLLSFYQPEEVQFVDIETTGLHSINPVFLVGILYCRQNQWMIRQYLARDYSEEKALLWQTAEHLKTARLITSYNGKSFDLPYLKGRMRYHRISESETITHIDLLRTTRRNYRKTLPNCRLLTIERYLFGSERSDDLPGSLVADHYHRYVETGDEKLIRAILKHNAEDLLSLAKLLGILVKNRKEGVPE